MKKFFSTIIFSTAILCASAQDKQTTSSGPVHISFGFDAGIPLGKDGRTTRIVAGADIQGEYSASESFSITASVGFDARLAKGGVVNTSYTVPVLAGFRYYFAKKLYFSEQAGYAFTATKGNQNVFADVAGVGFRLSPNSDVLLAYKGLFYSGNSFSTVGLRLAHTF